MRLGLKKAKAKGLECWRDSAVVRVVGLGL